MNHFVKIYGGLLRSTVWVGQPKHVKLTWLAMLVLADADGTVASSIPGLAREAEVTVPECEDALKVFLSPDPYSRTRDHDGRRISEVDGGWHIINHRKYREMRSPKQILNAKRQANWKAKHRAETAADEPESPSVTDSVTSVTGVTADASNNKGRGRGRSRTYSNGIGRPKDLTGKRDDGAPDASLPAPPGFAVPGKFKPLARHRKRCDERDLDLAAELKAFRRKQWRSDTSDWPARFDKWLDARERFDASDGKARLDDGDDGTGFESLDDEAAAQ